MGAIALGMIACKNGSDIPAPDPSDTNANTFVAFSIAMPHSYARAAATDVGGANGEDTYVGTANEQEVKKVRVVLYDENNHAAYTFDFNPASAHGDGSNILNEAPYYTTDAQKVEKKQYKALVLINPSSKVLAVTQRSMNLSEFLPAVEATVAELTSDGFFMSNAQGLAIVPESVMKPTKAEAEAAPFKDAAEGIKVDRAVAKVFVGGKPEVVPPSLGATVEILGWTLDVTNKKLFWMRNLANVVNTLDNFIPETIGDGTNRWDRYAMDPNFDGREVDENEFNYITTSITKASPVKKPTTPDFSSVVITNPAALSAVSYADADGQYVFENTMQPWAQYAPVTTRVIIKASFLPEGYPAGESWYSFDNVKMTKTQFLDYVTKIGAGEALPVEAPTGLTEAVKNAQAMLTHDFTADETGDSYVITFKEKTIKDKKLKFYKNAECYYAVKIRHFDDKQSSKMNYEFDVKDPQIGYGRYGIVRNNIYKLTLNTISQPGSPTIDIPTPDEKDDVEDVWLSVKTEILPWLVRVQSVDL